MEGKPLTCFAIQIVQMMEASLSSWASECVDLSQHDMREIPRSLFSLGAMWGED